MAERASHLSRYRPAVLVMTGIAAAFGIYALYSTFNESAPAKSALHRSNAVHRPRTGRAARTEVRTLPQTPDAPLGLVEVSGGNSRTLTFAMGVDAMPSADSLTTVFGRGAESLLPALNSNALYRILRSLQAILPDARFRQVAFMGLDSLAVAVSLRSRAGIRACDEQIRGIIPDLSDEDIEIAIDRIFEEFPQPSHPAAQHLDDETDLADTELSDGPAGPSQGLKGLLYHIAEDSARRKAYEHRGIQCDECGECPIRGVRWRCLNCPDIDLCSACEAETLHDKAHVFVKLRIPLPVLCQPDMVQDTWYPGDTNVTAAQLSTSTRQQLCELHDLEEPQVDAWYEQFRCIADVTFEREGSDVHGAISRQAFNVAMTSPRFRTRYMPNVLYNRMYAFYDSNGDGLIDFEEYVDGMAYLRGPRRFHSLRKALQGFDQDGDGFVDREDFQRLLRAKYDVQRLLLFDFTASHEFQETQAVIDTIIAGQTISAAFHIEEIPQGVSRQLSGKQADEHGDLLPSLQAQTILDDDSPWPASSGTRSSARAMEPRERLRNSLSRFEELLYGPEDDEDESAQSIDDYITGNAEANAFEDANSLQPSTLAADHDALWHIVREGLDHLLDSFFKAKEDGARDVERTESERHSWHREIDAFMAQEHEQKLASGSNSTVADAYDDENTEMDIATRIKAEILPTDENTLARLEEEIKFATLDDLLGASGYGHMDYEEPTPSSEEPSLTDGPHSLDISGTESTAQPRHESSFQDRMLDVPSRTTKPEQDTSQSTPSQSRLAWLASTQRLADEIEERGGPGRLSFGEVQDMVDVDITRELRGLVLGWLELASF